MRPNATTPLQPRVNTPEATMTEADDPPDQLRRPQGYKPPLPDQHIQISFAFDFCLM